MCLLQTTNKQILCQGIFLLTTLTTVVNTVYAYVLGSHVINKWQELMCMHVLIGCVVIYKQLHTGFPEHDEAYVHIDRYYPLNLDLDPL